MTKPPCPRCGQVAEYSEDSDKCLQCGLPKPWSRSFEARVKALWAKRDADLKALQVRTRAARVEIRARCDAAIKKLKLPPLVKEAK